MDASKCPVIMIPIQNNIKIIWMLQSVIITTPCFSMLFLSQFIPANTFYCNQASPLSTQVLPVFSNSNPSIRKHFSFLFARFKFPSEPKLKFTSFTTPIRIGLEDRWEFQTFSTFRVRLDLLQVNLPLLTPSVAPSTNPAALFAHAWL